MNGLGLALLLLAFVGGALALALALASNRRGRDEHLLGLARRMVYVSTAAILAASAVLLHLLVHHDFSNEYVVSYTDTRMPLLYLVTAFWGGQKGSLLLWVLLLLGFGSLAVHLQRHRRWAGEGWAIVFLMAIFLFFGSCLLFAADPFEQFLVLRMQDGDGLNPLLQNAAMVYHPPTILAGYAVWGVPFAYALAALVVGDLEAGWQKSLRPWTIGGWIFLTMGNLFGAFWAYTELGWGGFWGWDPVENASLMPWFTATAYVHSVMIQERRGMGKAWNMSLLMATFLLTLLGTFITRTGLIQSVHAFGKGSILGPMFLVFMIVVVITWAALMFHRRKMLAGRVPSGRLTLFGFAILFGFLALYTMAQGAGEGATLAFAAGLKAGLLLGFGSIFLVWALLAGRSSASSPMGRAEPGLVSQEGSFVLFNVVMSVAALIVLWGTIFPTLYGMVRGAKITIDAPWFNANVAPLGIAIIALIGLCPLLPWRRGSAAQMLRGALLPLGVAAAVTLAAHLLLRAFAFWYPGGADAALQLELRALAALFLASFALATVAIETFRAARIRGRRTGASPGLVLLQMLLRERRRYGGYLNHAAVALLIIGISGQAYKLEREEVHLRQGETTRLGDFEITFDALGQHDDGQKKITEAAMTIRQGGKLVASVRPAQHLFAHQARQVTTEVDTYHTLAQDLYLALIGYDLQRKEAVFKIVVNPLVIWLWIGSLLFLLGTGLVLLPRRWVEALAPAGGQVLVSATTGAAALEGVGAAGPAGASPAGAGPAGASPAGAGPAGPTG